MTLKIYTQDLGYRGAIVVTAKDEQQARSRMAARSGDYDPEIQVEEHPIEDDFYFENFGDR